MKLKALRHKARMTQAELAAVVGLNRVSISYIESGRSGTSRYLPQIANALGVDPMSLIKESTNLAVITSAEQASVLAIARQMTTAQIAA